MPTEPADDRGSASLLAIGVAFVLLGGCLVGVLWAAISVAHHRADAAADLAALTAAQALQTGQGIGAGAGVGAQASSRGWAGGDDEHPALAAALGDACAAAARVAEVQAAELRDCQQTGETVAVVVAVKLSLGVVGTPVLTGQARAGPIEGGDWSGDG